jgi:P-type E1-E2 ATPase
MFAMKPLGPEDANPEIEADRIEQKYQVLGITGVEDLLQDNVKECIEDFMEADIKVWMLTGDKGATAK